MAALWCIALGRALPFAPLDAALFATMASFVVYALVAILAFAVGPAPRLLAMLGAAAVPAAAVLLLGLVR